MRRERYEFYEAVTGWKNLLRESRDEQEHASGGTAATVRRRPHLIGRWQAPLPKKEFSALCGKAAYLEASGSGAEAAADPEERFFAFYRDAIAAAQDCELLLPAPAFLPAATGLLGVGRRLFRAPGLFLSHLRAALRASALGRVSLLLPALTTPAEVSEARRAVESAMQTLLARAIPFDEGVRVGLLLQSPAAALLSRSLVEEVDFLVLDTDRLLPLTLGMSKSEMERAGLAPAGKQGVLRLCEMAIGNAHLCGRFVGVSGEMAGDISLLPHFLGLGAELLILPPERIRAVRRALGALC